METVRIYEIPDCKMVSSGIGMFGEKKFIDFYNWFSSLPSAIFPKNFLFWDGEYGKSGSLHWLQFYENWMNVPEEFEIIDFRGGLYAVLTGIDQKTDLEEINTARDKFLETHGLEIDKTRHELGNIITTSSAEKVLGYNQMDYYTPIKPLIS